jgi:hypothetical protein
LVNPQRLLLPVEVTGAEARDFAHAQTAAQHQEIQSMIQRVRDLGKQEADLVLRQLLRQRMALPQEMAGLDGIGHQHLTLHHQIVEKVFEGMESTVDRRSGQLGLVLLLNEMLNVTPGHCPQDFLERRKKQAQIPSIILDRVRRIVPRAQIRTEELHLKGFHAYLPLPVCRWVIFVIACSYWCRLVAS